jgi:hypothetical protein
MPAGIDASLLRYNMAMLPPLIHQDAAGQAADQIEATCQVATTNMT